MVTGGLLRTAAVAGRNVMHMQKRTVVHGPPMRRMNVYQKFAIGGSMVAVSFITPIYILVNLKYYNKSASAE